MTTAIFKDRPMYFSRLATPIDVLNVVKAAS